MKWQFSKSLWAFLFCCTFLFSSSFLTKNWKKTGNNAVLSWDVSGYYFYLPTYFYDHLWHPAKIDYIRNTYSPIPGDDFYIGHFLPNGRYVMKYTCGMSIMYLPGFAMGHVMAKLQDYPADGFSLPYQFWLTMWAILVACIGLWVLRKVLLKYFSDGVVAISLLIICLATNYFNFVSFSGLLPHSFVFTLFAFLLFYTQKWYATPSFKSAFAIGLFAGLAALIRPTEIICIIIPLLWGVASIKDLKQRMVTLSQHWPKVALCLITAISIGSIQLLYWKYVTGHFIFWSYGPNETFSFLHPHIVDGLISYRKGWFTFTPVMLLSLVGFITLFKKHKPIFLAIFIFAVLNIYIVFSWDEWWYGGSFLQRAVIESYAFLLFPLASLITYLIRSKITGISLAIVLIFCMWLNLLMTWQVNAKDGFMESDAMTDSYYWRIFGKTSINSNDKKLLDTDEEMPHSFERNLKVIYTTDFENNPHADSTIPATSGRKAILLNKEKQFSPELKLNISQIKTGWIRAYAKVYPTVMEWNTWRMAQFILALDNVDKNIKEKGIKIHRIADPGKWQEIFVDIKIPEGENVNTLEVKFWNGNGDKAIFIDDVRVEAAVEDRR